MQSLGKKDDKSFDFDVTPAAPAASAQPAAATASAAAERNEFVIAGVIGAQLAEHVVVMQEVVRQFNETRKISRSQMQLLYIAIEQANKVARQSQQIARLAEGRVRQSHERLKLDVILEQALKEREPVLHQKGIEVERGIRAVEIIVDPGLLSTLIDSALDWAIELGQRLSVNLGIKNWPEHGLITIRASQSIVSGEEADMTGRGDALNWQLLVQVAKAMGVTLQRDFEEGEARLSMEFARTVKQLEGLTAMELDASGESTYASGTKPLAGHRVLLTTNDALVRAEVQRACGLLGLVVDTVPNARQAVRFVELDMPHMMIIDERVRDSQLDALIQDVKRHNPNFGLLEVADDANTFAIASWMSDSMTRVSRDLLRQQLPSLLTLELAKAL